MLSLFVLFYLCFVTINGDVIDTQCGKASCVLAEDCTSLIGMVPVDKEKYIREFPCYVPRTNRRPNAADTKKDFVCCANINSNGNLPYQSSDLDIRTQDYDKPKTNGWQSQNSRWNNNNPNSGADISNGQIYQGPNNNNNKLQQQQNYDPQYQDRYGNKNSNTDRQPNNFNNGPSSSDKFDSNKKPNTPKDNSQGDEIDKNFFFNGRYPGGMNNYQRPWNNDYQNPYFFGQNQNNFNNNQRQVPSSNDFAGQCSRLTNFPPDPNSGCCGKEASEDDRITGPQGRNANPGMGFINRAPSAPNFGLLNWIPKIFGFDNGPTRFSRETDTNTKVTIDTRITGGQVTGIEQFPWTVLLTTIFDYGRTMSAFNCGGSLISAQYVLTAAHCLNEEGARVQGVNITLAEYNKKTFPIDCVGSFGGRRCTENIVMQAEDIISHPEYDDSRLRNDIALIRLRGRAPYTEFIRPICLPPIDIDAQEYSGLSVYVAGWGRDGIYNSDVKQSTTVKLVPQRECKRYYSQLTRRHLCAAGYNGEDTCKGDSGGPLMILYEGKYFVSGIVSGKRADSPCGTSVPSLYTNVYQYLEWIRSNIRN